MAQLRGVLEKWKEETRTRGFMPLVLPHCVGDRTLLRKKARELEVRKQRVRVLVLGTKGPQDAMRGTAQLWRSHCG